MVLTKALLMAKPCTCGRTPVKAKIKRGGWMAACPASVTCKHAPWTGPWSTEREAVEHWNATVADLPKKRGAE